MSRRHAWTFWAVIAVLTVSAPFNPVVNQSAVFLPWLVVGCLSSLWVLNIAMKHETREADDGR